MCNLWRMRQEWGLVFCLALVIGAYTGSCISGCKDLTLVRWSVADVFCGGVNVRACVLIGPESLLTCGARKVALWCVTARVTVKCVVDVVAMRGVRV